MLSRITLRQLEYVVATAEAGSIIAASDRIHVSSPSISAAVSHVEGELGVQLFIRHHAQGLKLTAIGTQVMKEAKRILEQVANLYTAASESANEIRGPLRVGCFEALAPMLVPELVHGFAHAFPGVRISQFEGNQEDLLEQLRNNDLDIALTYDLQITADIDFEPLAQLPPHVLVGELHPLADRSAITLEELTDHPMVLLDMPYSRDYFLALFSSAGLTPDIRARSSSLEVVRSLVSSHVGYALFNVRPRSNLSLDGRRLVRVRLAGEHRAMQLGLAMAKAVKPSRLTTAFAQRCRTFVSNQYIPGMAAARAFDPRAIGCATPADSP
ncbi:LysR family transcriptional regulator [Variovorax sp. RB2P76]|jgi:DNA-binding transcriptional LysR family regulator|uniref:LysR family transcriptional regulator n=1 Tax=unclassified Variovorax TaxID=663243 RepID=UPI003F44B3FE